MDKPFWLSKTMWVNALVAVGATVSKYLGVEIGGDEALAVVAVANLILRISTKGRVTLS